MSKYCKNCGALIADNTNFCPECGKPSTNQNPSFIQKNSHILIILGVIIAVAIVAVGAFVALGSTGTFTQEVEVGDHTFEIPDYFEIDESGSLHETEGGITSDMLSFYSDADSLSIFVISNPSNDNLKSVVEDTSNKQELMGHTGYLEEDEYGYYLKNFGKQFQR